MATFNKLNKISRVVRKQASYPRQFLCASTLLSLLAFPATAAEESETEIKVDADIEVIEVSGGLTTYYDSFIEREKTQYSNC
jgi:hypothetical protein